MIGGMVWDGLGMVWDGLGMILDGFCMVWGCFKAQRGVVSPP